ncbi:hypothetical protein DFQ27_001287 [Actinomortierella ambigua]|uniref:Uncharacterized protein n=1 Tax=Actinomortierella ambigua TaxID=1343610 RepID=A0A9P6U8Z8_9FUNG|nr:hypothetical protein DFQ27_001287 [Actinomortierella ambigua]
MTQQRSTSAATHTAVRATPYSRENYLKLCSHSRLFGGPVLAESSCSHVECWDKGRHAQNTIHIPIRDGAPYQVGDVLDAVHARGYDILRFDVYPWRHAENTDIIEIVGKPLTNIEGKGKTISSVHSTSESSISSKTCTELSDFDGSHSSNDEYDDEYEDKYEDDEDEDEDESDGQDNNGVTAKKESSHSADRGTRALTELVATGIQVLGHPIQVLRPKGSLDHLWKVKVRGWETDKPLSELHKGLKQSFGPNREVVELELMGVKTKRSFWPSTNVTMYVRTVADIQQPKRVVIHSLGGLKTCLTLTWLTCLERCPGGLRS